MEKIKFLSLLFVVIFLSGCSLTQVEHGVETVAAIDAKIHPAITAFQSFSNIVEKTNQLERAGAPQADINSIYNLLHEYLRHVHEEADKHHKEHIQ